MGNRVGHVGQRWCCEGVTKRRALGDHGGNTGYHWATTVRKWKDHGVNISASSYGEGDRAGSAAAAGSTVTTQRETQLLAGECRTRWWSSGVGQLLVWDPCRERGRNEDRSGPGAPQRSHVTGGTRNYLEGVDRGALKLSETRSAWSQLTAAISDPTAQPHRPTAHLSYCAGRGRAPAPARRAPAQSPRLPPAACSCPRPPGALQGQQGEALGF